MALETRTAVGDELLIREILAGKTESFAELVHRHERGVHAAIWAVVRDHHVAQDLTQETFLKAYRQLESLRKPGTFGGWLLTIARRTATDHSRIQKRVVHVPDIENISTAGTVLENDSALLLNALAQLPEQEQQVILLRYFEDLPVADIAARLGNPVGTITKRLSRGIARLREQLKETP